MGCNGAGWPAVGSKVSLFHLFRAPIRCFRARFRRCQASSTTDLGWVVSIEIVGVYWRQWSGRRGSGWLDGKDEGDYLMVLHKSGQ